MLFYYLVRYFLGILISIILIKKVLAANCGSKETCGQCIQELNCFWCNSPKSGSSHCLAHSNLNICDHFNTENVTSSFKILEERILTETDQISPQRIQLKLRKNERYEIKFRYRQSANYPVDLYYLMDFSHSMITSKTRLAELGEKLADEMRRKTNNFRIGFGSFVDKLTLPFVNTHPDKLKEPCKGCAPPYSFINHLSLMNNATLFVKKVGESKLSGNLDSPEGGLDAVMQAIVCKKEIGWRSNARHLLVLSTDAVSHIAGDGKLGGIIEANDGNCHMENNVYTAGLLYDYPSLSHINYVSKENNINIIFAIVLNHENDPDIHDHLKGHYHALSTIIENSKSGTLDKNSDNVVNFIADIYDEIRDSVRITSETIKNVTVNISSTCQISSDGACTVQPGHTLDFTAIIEPLGCYLDGTSNKRSIKIKPEGLGDQLIVELEVLCECPCAARKEFSHKNCNNQGNLECGICRCNEGRFGANCQCDANESKGEDPTLCMKPDGKNETCSGQGKCICGKCDCKTRPDKNERIYGKYCDCDNFSCPQKCSGKGTCDCGKCSCENGWQGESCDCSTDQSQCLSPVSKELCSGHGKCNCGQCQCSSEDNIRYSGKYCEECTNCPAQRCEELKPCVECQVFDTGLYGNNSTNCLENCSNFTTINIVEKLEEIEQSGVKRCRLIAEQDCTIIFDYSYDEQQNIRVNAEKNKICPYLPSVLVYILGVISSVLLTGILALIIWKFVTTVHDKNEYAKFMDERNNTQWSSGENPLYKPGTSHFQNPVYKRASQRGSVQPMKTQNFNEKTEFNE